MTIKALMVDVDGGLIVPPDRRGWSMDVERDLAAPGPALQRDFFQAHRGEMVHGRAPLRERLAPVLAAVAPHLTCDELIDYRCGHDTYLNHPLLDDLASLRASGLATHLATVQEHERARYRWDVLGFRTGFDGRRYAAGLGCSKPSADFYTSIERRTGHRADELFLPDDDDDADKVEGARAWEWAGAVWTEDARMCSLVPEEPAGRDGPS